MKDEHREARRFWPRVTPDSDGCWIWGGSVREMNGYGQFAVKKPTGKWTYTGAHIWSHRFFGGVVPDGWEVDHLCRVRLCVRPDHLEAVTVQVNRKRRDERTVFDLDRSPRPLPTVPPPPPGPEVRPRRDRARFCRNGHEYAVVGRVPNGSGRTTCAECRRIQYAAKRKGGAHGTETHCPQGHPYIPENTYLRERGGRECRACIRVRNRAAYYRRKARQ